MTTPEQIDVYFAEEQRPVSCRSLAEMDSVLDRLHRECAPHNPICVNIAIPGYCVTIGLGTDPTFVLVNVEPCDGEWYISVGDESVKGWADFYGCGNHTPFERHTFIPLSVARQAVRDFVQQGKRTDVIRWRDWAGRPA